MSFPTITDEALASLRALDGQGDPPARALHRGGHARCHPSLGARHRRPQSVLGRGRVAPPTILFALDRIVSGYVGGLPGIHAMYAGTDFRWQRAIREGERVVGRSDSPRLSRRSPRPSRSAPSSRPTGPPSWTTAAASIGEADSWCFRTERDTARERGKYAPLEPHRYSEAEIARIRRGYAEEEIRGAALRALGRRRRRRSAARGGEGAAHGDVHHRLRAGLGEPLRPRPRPGLRSLRSPPRPRHPQRVRCPRAAGARALGSRTSRGRWVCPAPYDYGPERVAWLGHLVTNWMGNAGFLARLSVQVRRHNLIGDTTWCRGRVAAKALVDGRGEVTLDLQAVNQRDETIALGQAVVVLPRRPAAAMPELPAHAMPELPEVEVGRLIARRVAVGRVIRRVRCADDPIVFDGVTPARSSACLAGASRPGRAAARQAPMVRAGQAAVATPSLRHDRGLSHPAPGRASNSSRAATAPTATWPPRFAKLHLTFDDGGELVLADARRLGRVRFRHDPRHEPPIALLGFDAFREIPSLARFREIVRGRTAPAQGAPPRPGLRGRRGQLDRRRGAVPGEARSTPARQLAH